ncbi:pogo transposable element with KRAB domain isoform X2 [Maylandia zebra]|uniref:pogo transposable element with KRAB domain isoform X2 n=1 Tax=Maylandia zebra TaxID=106582 RepID=UPI00403CAED7
MSSVRLQGFRSFLTERLTAVAMEVFGEVESIVVECCEENKRLRDILHMVLNPEIKLHRIDVNNYAGEQPSVDLEISEGLTTIAKAGKIEYDLSWDQRQVLTEADNFITPVCVKEEHIECDISLEQHLGLGEANNDFTSDCFENGSKEEEEEDITDTNQIHVAGTRLEASANSSTDEAAEDGDCTSDESEADCQIEEGTSESHIFKKGSETSNTKDIVVLTTLKMAKRHAYEAQFKLKAISYAEEHGNRAAAREFKINESMVRNWRKLENKLRQVKKTQLSFRGHKARWPELEERLERWIIEQRSSGRSVSMVTIRLKAVSLAEEMNIEHFQGGPSWCFRFMKRCHFSIRTRTTVAQQLPADYKEKLAIFRSYCSKHIGDKNIQPSHITNMDEVPLTFDIPVSHTVEKKGTSTVAIRTTGYEKSSFTVVLGCHANGQKLPPMVIFKRKTLPKEKFPAGLIIKANVKGWMDEEMMKEWLREVYERRPGGFFHASPSLLICDSMRAHLTADVKKLVKQMNCELAVIPGGLTKELQPLDIGVNRPFKVRLRAAWKRWMTDVDHSFTKSGRQRRASYATICQWIVDAWANMSDGTVVRAFAKAGIISEEPHGTESDSDSEESEPGMFDGDLAQLFNSDTEDEDFDGFD